MLGTHMVFELYSVREEKGREMRQQRSVRVCCRSEESYEKRDEQREVNNQQEGFTSIRKKEEAGKYWKLGRFFSPLIREKW